MNLLRLRGGRAAGRWPKGLLTMTLAVMLAAPLAGCGGGDGSAEAPVTPIDTPAGAATLGATGGTVTHASGASIEVPADALSTETTLRVAQDSSGAPALPTGLDGAGPIYALTPHGSQFAAPVRVRIPANSITVGPNEQLKLAKAEVGGAWTVLADSALDAQGLLTAEVSSFSYFVPVRVSYPLAVSLAQPLGLDGFTVSCSTGDCKSLAGPTELTIDVRTSGLQLPSNCVPGTLTVQAGHATLRTATPIGNGVYRAVQTLQEPEDLLNLSLAQTRVVRTELLCQSAANPAQVLTIAYRSYPALRWVRAALEYPNLAVANLPAVQEVVAGRLVTLRAIFSGGASGPSGGGIYSVSANLQAVVEWQRSDDSGASWQTVGVSYESEALRDPFKIASLAGRYWQVSHSVMVGAADGGAQFRVRGCFNVPSGGFVAPTTTPCVVSTATRWQVLQATALPAIDTPPRAVLVRTGQTASFTATATGAPAPTLQWQTRAANSSGAWTDVPNATAGTYTTAVLGAADNGRQMRVVATNALGSAESAPVTVSVSELDVAPTVTTQPASIAVAAGGDAVFAVAARGTEALSYQWRFNGAAITGANAAVLRLGAVGSGNAGRYSVVVSNAAGSATSSEATLSVTAGVPAPVVPTITTPPGGVRVNAGNSATFAVGVGGTAPFTYQWLRNGEPIAGATSAFFSLATATAADAGAYAVRVSNAAGSTTSTAATLTVVVEQLDAPVAVSLATAPAPQVQPPGGSATFAVAASGTGPISYQWLKNGAPIAGASGPVLLINAVASSDAASYAVTVTNAVGSLTSPGAALTVVGAPVLTVHPQPANVLAGATATFSASASGTALGYQWVRNGVAINGATAASYTTPALATGDSGAVYSVIVYNGAGVALSQLATLTVQAPEPPTPSVTLTLASADIDQLPASGAVSQPSASADGQRVAFLASGTGLVAGQGSANAHAYVRDLATGTTQLVNITTSGGTSARGVNFVKISGNGRYVLFTSLANDLVPGDTNIAEDVFVRDLQTGTTARVNVLPNGRQDSTSGNSVGKRPDISADGRYVLMTSSANLAGGGEQGNEAYYLWDGLSGSARRVTLNGDLLGSNASLSADGTVAMVLTSLGSQLALEAVDVATATASVVFTTNGADNLSAGSAQNMVLSADGRTLAFVLYSPTWFGGAAASRGQIVVFDRQAGGSLPNGLTLISANGATAGDGSSDYPSISADGRYVGYRTAAPNLTGGAANASAQMLVVHDRQTGTNTVVSRSRSGSPVNTSADAQAVLANGTGAVFLAPAQQMLGGSLANTWQAFVAPRP